MNKRQLNHILWPALWMMAILSPTAPGQSQEARRPSIELDAFRLIVERNIFDPSREKPGGEAPPIERAPQADEIVLVGTLVTESQRFAFFDGSSSSYRRVLTVGADIAGGAVAAIESATISIRLDDNTFDLPIGMSLSREDDQPWRIETVKRRIEPEKEEDNKQPAPANDILRKLMERRSQEQNQ